MQVSEVDRIAQGKGWTRIAHQENIKMISFVRCEMRVNVYYSTMTVATCLHHPKKGRTQMFRRWVTEEMLAAIFENPRVHTDRGYYRAG